MSTHVSPSFKRSRSNTPSLSPSPEPEPTPKAARTALPSSSSAFTRQLMCTLPPTCHPPENRPTYLSDSHALEAHYATYHAHVCEVDNCGCVFPDARLLELHQTECHDPLAAVRCERGEKIFACHVPTCTRRFQTPKARRLHMIEVHAYPKEYFFAITNKGIGGLLRKWGEGASLLRGSWKPRDPEKGDDDKPDDDSGDMDTETETDDTSTSEPADAPGPPQDVVQPRRERHTPAAQAHTRTTRTRPKAPAAPAPSSASVDELAASMNSLSLLPPSVRFGRGAVHGGFLPRGRGYGRGAPRGGRQGMIRGGSGGVSAAPAPAPAPDEGGQDDSRTMVPRALARKRGAARGTVAAEGGGGRGRRENGRGRGSA